MSETNKAPYAKTRKILAIVFIAIFLLLIFFFPILWICGVPAGDNFENREPAKAPEFGELFTDYGNFASRFEKYYNDAIPFRSGIMSVYSYLNYKWFGISVVPKVTSVGKHGWLFYEDFNTRNVISGDFMLTQDQLDYIYQGITAKYEALKKLGKSYVVYIAPEKQSVYPEYDRLRNSDYTCAEQLLAYLAEKNCPATVIYGKNLLLEKKNGETVLYYKYDSHWNALGGFYAYRQLIDEVGKLVDKDFPVVDDGDYTIQTEKYENADLATVLTLTRKLTENAHSVKYNAPITATYQTVDERLTVAKSDTDSDLKVFLYGDSFSDKRFWGECFLRSANEVRFLHNRNDFATLLGYAGDCDVVIEECVARVLTTLGNS